jgi:hypothetical protein
MSIEWTRRRFLAGLASLGAVAGAGLWPQHEMVHGSALERFAKYPDGRIEKPETSG